MFESEHKAIVDFTNNLSTMRQQVSDRELLDKCQLYLVELIELSKDDALDPDPPAEAAA